MNPRPLPPPQLHYHIRWSGKNTLDWEVFPSRAEAEAGAAQLVRPGETYTIEARDSSCPECQAVFGWTSSDGDVQPEMKYPDWQKPLSDALVETRPEQLRNKIGIAERMIHKRLLELSRMTGGQEELRAIKEGLKSLQILFPDAKQKKDSA